MKGKLFSIILILSTILTTKIVLPDNTLSQSCPHGITIDTYRCQDPNEITKTCGSPVYAGYDVQLLCGWSGGSCVSISGWCSNNDSCIYNENAIGGYCTCTSSPVDCNNPGGGGGGGGCDTTVPSVQSIEWGADTVTINFYGGVGGTRNDIAFGSNKTNVATKCLVSGVGCTTMTNVSSPLIVAGDSFSDGTVYYFKVWNIDGACTKTSEVKQDISSCEISPNIINLNMEDPAQTLTSEVVSTFVFASSPTEVKVTFSSDDMGVASVDPSSETNSYVYQTGVSPVGVGSTSLRSNTYLDNVLSCTATSSTVNVNDAGGISWWQVIDGDITTNEDLSSDVPVANVFIDDGAGGYPGVPVYETSLSVVPGTTSSTNWNVNTATIQPRIFNYSYFENLIPDDVIINDIGSLLTGGVTSSDGYEWYKVTGNLSIDSLLNLASRKIILFVSEELNINNEIWVTDGIGFFGAFVGGNINVSGEVTGVNNPSLEGIYLTNGIFSTGIGTGNLFIRGSVSTTAGGGINLQRVPPENSNPSEVFEFAPDQILLFPKSLMFKRTKWAEVSP